MVNEEIKKQETPVDLEAQVNENEQAIANPTNNADDEPAVDSEAEVNTEAESNENQIINNQIINTMKENSNSTVNGNNEQGSTTTPEIEISNTTNNDDKKKHLSNPDMAEDAEIVEEIYEQPEESSEETIAIHSSETLVFDAELQRILADTRYHAIQIPGSNCRVVMDLTAAKNDGIDLYGIAYNRKHGRDEKNTGTSIKKDGAQHLPIVIPVKVAYAAGIPIGRFEKDTNKDAPIKDDGLVILDAHGRINHAMGESTWPQFEACFPVKNCFGQMNSKKVFQVINEKATTWKGEDYIIPKLFDSSDLRSKVFEKIHELQNNDYLYTAACEWTRFQKGNITKTTINASVSEEEAKKFMQHMDTASQIHAVCIKIFGEGDDKLLKTKKFVETIIDDWDSLVHKKGDEEATKLMIAFIESLSTETVSRIRKAKKDDVLDKDAARKHIFQSEFNVFVKKNGIEI